MMSSVVPRSNGEIEHRRAQRRSRCWVRPRRCPRRQGAPGCRRYRSELLRASRDRTPHQARLSPDSGVYTMPDRPGKGQVTPKNAVRASSRQRSEELASSWPPDDRSSPAAEPRSEDPIESAASGEDGLPATPALLWMLVCGIVGYVGHRDARHGHRRRRAAPDGVPRIRLRRRRDSSTALEG